MSANRWGHIFSLLSFGESHGSALGVVIEGCPAGLSLDPAYLAAWMDRRRPGQSRVVSDRDESDEVEVLSGVFEGKTLGTPLAMMVRNRDARSEDYESIKHTPRPGHADDVWQQKFGHRDHRGGGRSSGRETISRVMAGAVAASLVKRLAPSVEVLGYCTGIGPYRLGEEEKREFLAKASGEFPVDAFLARFPSPSQSAAVEKLLSEAKTEGRSYGGEAEIRVRGLPAGLGQPVFRKLKSDLAQVSLSLGASMSFELGQGRDVQRAEGSRFHQDPEAESYGGIRGGLSTGGPLGFRVAFKPTSSVMDVAKKGRHDPCILPRALPVLEAMTWIVLADHLLWSRLDKI
jgi:chorismate synthase